MKLIILLLTSLFVFSTPVIALDETPSATDSQAIKDELKNRIQNTIKENLDSAQASLQEKLTTPQILGLVGVISKVTAQSITLELPYKKIIQVVINENTAIVKSGNTIKLEAVPVNDKLIAIGTLQNSDILSAIRLVVTPNTPAKITKNIYLATVSTLSGSSLTLSLTDGSTIKTTLSSKITPKPKLAIGDKLITIISTTIADNSHTVLALKQLSSPTTASTNP